MKKSFRYKKYLNYFIRLFDKGLVYRANRPINWCCTLKSAISDAEVYNLAIAILVLLSGMILNVNILFLRSKMYRSQNEHF